MPIFDAWFNRHSTTTQTAKSFKRGFLSSGITGNGWDEEEPVAIVNTIDEHEIAKEMFKVLADDLEYLKGKSVCMFCERDYIRDSNIGRMNCSWHPYPGSFPYKNECCGRPKQSHQNNGCKPCDHSVVFVGSRWDATTQFMDVPLQIALHLSIPRQNYTISNPEDPYLVKAVVKRCEGI